MPPMAFAAEDLAALIEIAGYDGTLLNGEVMPWLTMRQQRIIRQTIRRII